MEQRLQVIGSEQRSGVAKATGNAYNMTVLSCILHDSDGRRTVGNVILPKDHPPVGEGTYVAEFRLSSYQGRIDATIKALRPVK